MSADLLEAFGQGLDEAPSGNTGSQNRSATTSTYTTREPLIGVSDSVSTSQQLRDVPSGITKVEPVFQPGNDGGNDVLFDAAVEQENEDDEFGDFEDVNGHQICSSQSQVSKHPTENSNATLAPPTELSNAGDGPPLVDLLSLDDAAPQTPNRKEASELKYDFFNVSESTSQSRTTPHTAPWPVPQAPVDDDGWGDFEAAASTAKPTPSSPAQRNIPRPAPTPSKQTPASTNPQLSTPASASAAAPKPPDPTPEDADDWEAFEDGAPIHSHPPSLQSSSHDPPPLHSTQSSIPPDPQRPTNIPPPSTLLSLLPTTFQSLVEAVISSSPTPATDLPTQVIITYRTAGRIVSARTLRWRRDAHLSQSTRIGLAGKSSGGMKLSSLNKGESMKEEREAAEAVDAWSGNLHHFSKLLKAAVATINLKLSMNMSVKTLSGPGVVQAPLVCPLCGLKRSERVVGVDEQADDVFGEYWLENWGHRECAEWWYRWKAELGQR